MKNMYLNIDEDGNVVVSAPLYVEDDAIFRFVRKHGDWIERTLQKVAELPKTARLRYVDGELLPLWGRKHPLRIVPGFGRVRVELLDGEIILTKPHGDNKSAKEHIKKWHRAVLRSKIAELIPKWERLTTLTCDSWQVRDMKTRWGTCSLKNRKLWFALQLVERPPECLEMIVLHELLHLAEGNHSANFYKMMDNFMPRWREAKQLLKERT